MANEIFATLNTSLGKIVIQLYPEQAPETVANFTELAEGARTWTDPRTGQKSDAPLYNGTIFHRVIDQFMLQGGDPLGTGTGGPGYQFKDELHPDLKFNRPYLLAMANAGPGTNGSQFFITLDVGHTQHLTGQTPSSARSSRGRTSSTASARSRPGATTVRSRTSSWNR